MKDRLEKIIRKRVEYQYIPKQDCYMIGNPSDLAQALIDAGLVFKDELTLDEDKIEAILFNDICTSDASDSSLIASHLASKSSELIVGKGEK